MDFYTRMANTAAKLLKQKGRGVQYLIISTVQDLANADSTTVVATTSVNAVDFDAPPLAARRYRADSGQQVLVGDRLVYISGRSLDADPKPGDKITMPETGATYSVIELKEKIAPGGTAVLYVVQVRV